MFVSLPGTIVIVTQTSGLASLKASTIASRPSESGGVCSVQKSTAMASGAQVNAPGTGVAAGGLATAAGLSAAAAGLSAAAAGLSAAAAGLSAAIGLSAAAGLG